MVNTELTDEMEDDLELALEYVREQEEIEGAVKALLFDDEMEALAKTCVDDGEWDPPSPVQEGRGDEPQPGPSNQLQYTMKKTSQCTYAKNAAIDRTYKVKKDEKNNGQQLKDVREGLHDMMQDVLNQARRNLARNDLGRVVVHHEGLYDPVVVPL